ncbi:hypothetical protein PO909_027952 [Leuciscus waleckii]
MEGDSVTLNPDLTDIQRDEQIQWRFGNIRIAKVIMNIIRYDNDERFRDRLKLDQTGSLTISDIRTTDSGLYQLRTIIRNKEFIKRFNVTVDVPDTHPTSQTPSQSPPQSPSQSPPQSPSRSHPPHPPPPPPPPPPLSVSLIVLISSSAAGSILAVIMIFCMCRKHRDTVEDETHADATLYTHTGQMMKSEMTEVVYTCLITDQ